MISETNYVKKLVTIIFSDFYACRAVNCVKKKKKKENAPATKSGRKGKNKKKQREKTSYLETPATYPPHAYVLDRILVKTNPLVNL